MRVLPLLFVLALGCPTSPIASTPEPTPEPTPAPTLLEALVSPAPAGARFPSLVPTADAVLLTWLRSTETGAALEFATLQNDGSFSAPATVVDHPDLLVNWADGGSIAAGDDHWVAYWLQRVSGGYHAFVARSEDEGDTWTTPVRLHDDDSASEHGFVVALPQSDGTTPIAWLDGRAWADDEVPDETALMVRTMDASGALGPESVIDARGCDCCPTDGVATGDRTLVAYRDRTEDEIRDIAVVAYRDGVWGDPVIPVADGWEINGCPVNGPSIVANASGALLTWLTAADSSSRVQAVRLAPDGSAAAAPVLIAGTDDVIGRVDSLLREDGSALVTWVERDGGANRLWARWMYPNDTLDAAFDVAPLPPGSGTGSPQILEASIGIVVAWTEPTTPATLGLGLLR